MSKQSRIDGAHSPEGKPGGVGAEAVIQFPDWSARLQELPQGGEEKEAWRRGIVALLKHCSAQRQEVTRQAAREFWKLQRDAGAVEVKVWVEAYRWYCAAGHVDADHVKHHEEKMAPWEQGLFRAMRVGSTGSGHGRLTGSGRGGL